MSKNAATQAIKDAKLFTSMARGLIALEDELGDLSDLERARSARQAALQQVNAEIAERGRDLEVATASVNEANEQARVIIDNARIEADRIIRLAQDEKMAAASALAQAQESAEKMAANSAAKADESAKLLAAVMTEREAALRETETARAKLAQIKAEMAAIAARAAA